MVENSQWLPESQGKSKGVTSWWGRRYLSQLHVPHSLRLLVCHITSRLKGEHLVDSVREDSRAFRCLQGEHACTLATLPSNNWAKMYLLI